MKKNQHQFPARLSSAQMGQIFCFQAHEIKALIRAGLLKPLSNRSAKKGGN